MDRCAVGCDIGTGGTKAIVLREDGRILGAHFVEYGVHHPAPGRAEQDPETYWRAACEAIRGAVARAGIPPDRIRAAAFSGLSPCVILVDEHARPLGPSLVWMDRRAEDACAWIRERIDERHVIERSANGIDPFYGLPKLLWIRRHRPDLYRRAHRALSASSFVVARACGHMGLDLSTAALYGIAFDIRRRDWDASLLEALGVPRVLLGDLRRPGEIVGEVSGEAARACGLRAGTPLLAGGVDGAAAALASGVLEPGDTALALGSSANLYSAAEAPAFGEGLITCYHPAEPERLLYNVGATVCGGALLRYLRDTSHGLAGARPDRDAYDALTRRAAEVPAGAGGLVILPYLLGERTPIWDPHARGVAFGFGLEHGPAYWARAVLESVAFSVRHNVEACRAAGGVIRAPLAISEGGARSPLWRQIMADVTGMPIVYAGTGEGAPLGDAVLAGTACDLWPDARILKAWRRVVDVREPDPSVRALYDDRYGLYRTLYDRLRDLFPGAGPFPPP